MRNLAALSSKHLNRVVEALVVLLMALLVLVVWIGVIDRYIFHWQLPWPQILARYLMIWTALLAISCAIARREHIGLLLAIELVPEVVRRMLLIAADLLGFALFAYLFWYGLDFAAGGINRQAMVFGLSLAPVFAAIPVAAGLSAIQLALVMLRDLGQNPVMGDAMGSE
ncbi:TRAP transporter small permease [Rhodovibrio salinarum]|uniref:TRAP transporter small permease protein n=1 Tax=Rhodovibrio salinarum TaxID=1087 RepID=A0A934UZJ8_9PROT|nr:TRAP transporter small permease [Rhodovibrio salinarum]MBK1696596.1 TRAP transporter small permease [Rhodovibrio salinarum]